MRDCGAGRFGDYFPLGFRHLEAVGENRGVIEETIAPVNVRVAVIAGVQDALHKVFFGSLFVKVRLHPKPVLFG